MMRFFKLGILALCFALSGVAAPAQSNTIHAARRTAASRTGAVCVLSTASNGQAITVQGEVRNEPHDMGFDIFGCKETVLLTFAGYQDNDVSGKKLHRDRELRRFQKYTSSVYKSTGKSICIDCAKYGDVEAELTGKLEIATVPPGATVDPFGLLRDHSGKVIGRSGWGHPIPFAHYRLVIFSVAHVKARRLPPPNP